MFAARHIYTRGLIGNAGESGAKRHILARLQAGAAQRNRKNGASLFVMIGEVIYVEDHSR